MNLNKKITSSKTKHLIVENKFKKIEAFDTIYFLGKNILNYLVFQTTQRYFKRVRGNKDHVLSWKSKGLSDGSIRSPSRSNNILNPLLGYVGTKTRVEFKGSCWRQDKISFDHEKLVNISTAY